MSAFYFKSETKLFLEITTNDESSTDKPNIVFCVDKSGSMSGGPMNNVNTVLKQIYQVSGTDYPLLCYDYALHKRQLSSVTDTNMISAGGGTSFKVVFDEMVESLTSNVKPTTFIFMTDGQDTSWKPDELEESIKKLKMICTAMPKTAPVTIHVIGFGSGVKSDFLERVRTLGNVDGLFKYSTVSAELQSDFMDMFDLASNQREYKIKFGGTNFKQSSTGNTITMLINYDDIDLDDSDDENDNTDLKVLLTDSKGNKTKITAQMKSPTSMDRLKVLNLIEPETEDEVKYVIRSLYGINKSGNFNEKLAIEKMKKDINDRMREYLDLFTKIKMGQVKDEVKLRLNALKHKATFSNMDAQRRLDMRVNKNTEYFQKTDIDGILKGYVENDMTPEKWKHIKSISENWKCIYTHDNLHDMMRKSHDNIMCIGALVERTEDAINNPAKGLKLVKLSNSLISYDSFIEYLTKNTQDALTNGNQEYGDFDSVNNSYCLVGVSREKINTVIPLYLDEEHMKRIRILEGIWLGHMYTLNSFGYDKNQEIGLLKILWQMMEQYDGTEYQGTIISEFSKVGKFIVTESDGFASAYGKDTFKNFIDSVNCRQLAITDDLEIILTIGFLTGEQALYKSLIAVYEELIRRRYHNLKKSMSKSKIHQFQSMLLYGTKQTTIAVRQSRIMEKDDDPDYVEQSYIDYFRDEMKTPLQLIEEKSTLTDRKQICSFEPEMFNDVDLSLPPFLEKFLQYVGLNKEWLEKKSDKEMLRRNILMGMFIDKSASHIKFENVLKYTDELNQGPIKNAVCYTLNDMNVELVANKAVNCKTIEGFAGILRKYCPTRCGLIYNEIIIKLLDAKSIVVLRKEKLYGLLSNHPFALADGSERYGQLYIGEQEKTCWKPSLTQLNRLKEILGDESITKIEKDNISKNLTVRHRYRESGKPNRHGHSNLYPNPDLTYTFKGY